MSQFNQTRIQRTRSAKPGAAMATVIALSALLTACSPQDDQAGTDGSSVASDSADRTIRSTAGEAVERARQANGGATNTDAAAGAAASGSSAAAQSAEKILRKTEAEVKAADEKLDKAREDATRKIPGTPAQ